MQMKHLSFLAVFAFLSLSAGAQTKGNDASNHPESYFLRTDQVASSLKLLPPPPQPGSAYFNYDQAQYQWGKMQRITPRGKQAKEDAQIGNGGIERAFAEAFGLMITKETSPELYKLIQKSGYDASLSTREAKNHYLRMRPFMLFKEQSLTPEDEAALSKNGSYPSGHTAIGWTVALILTEINPGRQDEILKRGFEYGQSRVICGVHYQSDVDAGRIVAAGLVARLHADKAFQQQLAKAKQEFAKLVKAGKAKDK